MGRRSEANDCNSEGKQEKSNLTFRLRRYIWSKSSGGRHNGHKSDEE